MKVAIKKLLTRAKRFYKKLGMKIISLGDGDIAIDCGANVGSITAILARNGATVYAFEPNPVAFAELERRFENRSNVHCINKGVYTEDTTMKLYLHANAAEDPLGWSEGGSLVETKTNINRDNYVEVDIVDLDRFIGELSGKVKVLKIDIEGAETELVPRLIESGTIGNIDHVFVETHDDKNPQLRSQTDRMRAMVREKGFKHVDLDWT